MPKSIVLGNGNLNVNFDEKLQLKDFYYPFVGSENHSDFESYNNRIGVFVDNSISWLGSDPEWKFYINYHPNTLIGNSLANNSNKKLSLKFEDFVCVAHDIFVRKITIKNEAEYERNIKIFAHHNFHIYGQKQKETVLYEPELNAVCHYRNARYFLVNGLWDDLKTGMNQFSTGISNYQGHEGTFRDAEDGILECHPIEQGSVDSTVGFESIFKPGETRTLWIWVAVGKNEEEIKKNNDRIISITPQQAFNYTESYWKAWSKKSEIQLNGVNQKIKNLWRKSALIVQTHVDNGGAIMAATDSDVMIFNRDTYTYTWMRDGSLISMAMSNAGFSEISKNFLLFCKRVITHEGYFHHNYTPEGFPGTSWHPKWKDGKIQIPIQEDESALVLVALENYYKNTKDIELIRELFDDLVLKIGNFLINFTDNKTSLPLPSYGIWEERRGIYSYTTSTVYAGLISAANIAKEMGESSNEILFRSKAEKIKSAMLKYLFCSEKNRFLKRIKTENEKIIEKDDTTDSSLSFIWDMGVLPPDDPRIVSTMEDIEKNLTNKTGGLCRYRGDRYQRNKNHNYSETISGNTWVISTLWLANWKIAIAKNQKDLKKAKDLIEWVESQANSAGILPEQIDPFENKHISVAPLTWSQSSFLDTVQRFSEKYDKLNIK